MLGFPSDMHSKIGYYVYRLIDPRNGATFYVGKGKGDRVFAHLNEAIKLDGDQDEVTEKLKTIRQIKKLGLEPIHIIHRHGMTEEEAFLAEAILIDTIPGLSNLLNGHGSSQFGPAHAFELIQRYQTSVMEIDSSHKVIAINLRVSIDDDNKSLYDSVRFAWRVSIDRANKADFVFAVTNGICREVFVLEGPWLDATPENFPGLAAENVPGRFGFRGSAASTAVLEKYKNKRLPENLQRKKGMASPVLYNYL
jgi:hypothetical protein